jgi:flagella basal body P-ring formation protein FlgA
MPTAKTTYRTLLAAMAVSTMLTAAPDSDAASLNQTPTVTGPMIRLGDLFEGAGEQADTIVLEAPAPGMTDDLTSYELERIADQYGLDWERPTYLKRLTVRREGTAFALDDLHGMVLDAATEQGLTGDVEIKVYGSKRGLFLPVDASVADIEIQRFTLTDRMDRFTATLLVPTGTGNPRSLNITGSLDEVRLVPMLTRVVAPGEIITQADIAWESYPAKRLSRNSVIDQQSMIGQTVRRPLRPGMPLRANDLKAPVMIEKGSMVKMTINAGALTLTASGRALQDGGAGDTIRVMNTKSKQSVEAQVLRPGLVKVTSNNLALAAL